MNNIKPTFGVKAPAPLANNDRAEFGALWEKTSKANKPYFSIKLNLTKAKLKELLAAATAEEININLVAFPNDNKQEGDNKPNFRIYEELKR